MTEGYAAAAPTLTLALEQVLAADDSTDEVGRWLWLAGSRPSATVAVELWDAESWHFLAARQAQVARDTGALAHLRLSLNLLAGTHLLAGELTTAAQIIEEDRLIAEATGNAPIAYTEMMLAAWRGREAQAAELIEATLQEATARGLGRFVAFASYASSVLYNGLGRHETARDAAWRAFERDLVGFEPLVVPELAEAASRTGDVALLRTALEWLSERTRVTAERVGARDRGPGPRHAQRRRGRRESLPRVDRAPRPYPRCAWSSPAAICSTANGCDARTDALTRASSCAPPMTCSRRWASRRSPSGRGASSWPRARLSASAATRPARRAHRPGGSDRAARPRRTLEPRDRHPAVHQPAHRPVPPAQGLYQARHQLAQRARPRPASRLDHRPAALAAGSMVGAAAATTTGHSRCALADAMRARGGLTLAGMSTPGRTRQSRCQFRTIDGLTIRFAESEDRDDHALLLSPWPESLFAFEPTWVRLAERTHLVAIDLPGFGHSQRATRCSPRGRWASSSFVVADAFGLEHPHVVGPDIGTGASLFAAALYPGRLRSLVVGSGGVGVPAPAGWAAEGLGRGPRSRGVPQRRPAADRRRRADRHRALRASGLRPRGLPLLLRGRPLRRVDALCAHATRRSFRSSAICCRRSRRRCRSSPAHETRRCRRSTPSFLHERLPKSKLDIVDAGHFTWEDAADEYAALVTSWWGGGHATTQPGFKQGEGASS